MSAERSSPESNYWADLDDETQASLRRIAQKLTGLVTGIGPDGAIPDLETALAVLYLQQVEVEVLEAFCEWQSRTKALFEKHGWPWTTGELLRRAYLWEHE